MDVWRLERRRMEKKRRRRVMGSSEECELNTNIPPAQRRLRRPNDPLRRHPDKREMVLRK